MARLGMTHGGFYAHFQSKEDLIAQAIGAMFEDSRRRFNSVTSQGNARQRLRAYIDMYLSPAHRDQRDRGCPLPSLSADFARMSGAVQVPFGKGVAALNGLLAALLVDIGQPEPDSAAVSMLAEMVGAVLLARATGDRAQSDAILATTHASLIARFGLGETGCPE
jgi:TetR/AcrR family transcriptional repressor of nem operon